MPKELEFEIGWGRTGSGKRFFGRLEQYRSGEWVQVTGKVEWTNISRLKRIGVLTVKAGDFPEGTVLRYRYKPYRGNVEYEYYVVRGGEFVPARVEELRKKIRIDGVEVEARGHLVEGEIEDIHYYVVPGVGPVFTLEEAEKAVRRLVERSRAEAEAASRVREVLSSLTGLIPEWADGILVEAKRFLGKMEVTGYPVKRSKFGEGWYLKNTWRRVSIPGDVAEELAEGGEFAAVVTRDGRVEAVRCESGLMYTNCSPVGEV